MLATFSALARGATAPVIRSNVARVGVRALRPAPAPQQPARRFVAAAAGDAGVPLLDRLKADMKTAMKEKAAAKLDAIRFLNAAIKSREIELREKNAEINEAEIIKVIQKLAKQRADSIESYRQGGRDDLVAKEQAELDLLNSYLPAMMSATEVEAVVSAVISETGASSIKDMKAVMGKVSAQTAGRADGKMVSDIVKAKLTGGK